MGAYCLEPFRGSELSQGSSILVPRDTACGPLAGAGYARCVVVLCPERALSDAEQSFSHMRNMRTVKVTYWGPIFFCGELIVFCVSRGLWYPSGGGRG